MSQNGESHEQPARTFVGLPRHKHRKLLLVATLRAGITISVLILAYFLLPFTLVSQTRYLTILLVGMGIVIAVLILQFSRMLRSPYPRLRAIEAMMTSGPLFVVLFATLHYVIADLNRAAYSEPMTRLDALYFTVTTFATVGYGDLSPVSQMARLVALVQMVGGLLLVGVIAKLLFGIAQQGERQVRPDPADQNPEPRHRS